MGKRGKKSSEQPASSPASGFLRRDGTPAPTTVGVKLPLAYLKILEEEATHFEATRSQFLSMLLKRKLGLISFDRPKAARDYEFSDDDLRETKLYLWYLSQELREAFAEDRLQMGKLGAAAWIVVTLNEWIGRPKGLRSEPDPSD